MKKRDWVILGFISSVIWFFGGLILFLVVGNNLVPTPIFAFAGALGYFISWWLIGWPIFNHFQSQKQKCLRKQVNEINIS